MTGLEHSETASGESLVERASIYISTLRPQWPKTKHLGKRNGCGYSTGPGRVAQTRRAEGLRFLSLGESVPRVVPGNHSQIIPKR